MKTRSKISAALAIFALGAAGVAYAWVATPQSCRISADKVGVEIKASMEAWQRARAQECSVLPYPQNVECVRTKVPTTEQLDAQRAQYVEMLYQQCLSGQWVPLPQYQ